MNLILLVLAFLLGAVPSGYLIGRYGYGVDLRKAGSGNTGATNAGRALGKKAGIFTLLADVLKGVIAVCLPCVVLGVCHSSLSAFTGLMAILGHCYSPFLNFQGGKGIATSLGVFAVLLPTQMLISVAAFVVMFIVSRIVSLSSLAGAVALFAGALSAYPEKISAPAAFAAVVASALAIYRHKANIERLLRGEEKRFSA